MLLTFLILYQNHMTEDYTNRWHMIEGNHIEEDYIDE